jgi:hypothetical protein
VVNQTTATKPPQSIGLYLGGSQVPGPKATFKALLLHSILSDAGGWILLCKQTSFLLLS